MATMTPPCIRVCVRPKQGCARYGFTTSGTVRYLTKSELDTAGAVQWYSNVVYRATTMVISTERCTVL